MIATSNTFKLYAPDIRVPTAIKIEGFAALKSGWHYGSGGPISPDVISRSIYIVGYLLTVGFTRTDAFANEDGDVLVTAYHSDHYLGIGVGLTGLYALNHEIGGVESSYSEDIDLNQLKSVIIRVARSIWTTSDSYTHQNSTRIPASSMTWHLRSPPGMGECQSSNWTARTLPVAA
jgi:hypothetical protein